MAQSTAVEKVIIAGAGPAGLAVGACLQRAGIAALLLEQNDRVGSAWHRHYDRLHLHTDKAHSTLPFVPFPKSYPRYLSRLQLIDYLEAYAQRFRLEPRFGQCIQSARYTGSGWEVQTQDARYLSENLVIATGYNREPNLPSWPGQLNFKGDILHSSQYRNAVPFADQTVLVVGFGNSGGEIALDLCESGARTSLAVRSPVNVIPRELFGIPILTIGILQSKLPPRLADALNAQILGAVIGDLSPYGLKRLPYGPMTQIQSQGRIPLIDIGTIQLIKRGKIRVHPGIARFTEQGVRFADGSEQPFDTVILATGYRPRVDAFLLESQQIFDENGTPLSSGREARVPGLYFCGFYVSPTGMLREVALEARQIAAAVGRKYHA